MAPPGAWPFETARKPGSNLAYRKAMTERTIGAVLQFELSAAGPGQGGVSGLLAGVAHTIEELGAVEVVDLVFRPARDAAPAAVSVYFVRLD
jgi:hypothetical protein